MKTQETIEEASKRYSYGGREGGHRIPFLEGVKWQQERSYSEEEVLKIIQNCKEYLAFGDEFDEIKWFEQFKKKKATLE